MYLTPKGYAALYLYVCDRGRRKFGIQWDEEMMELVHVERSGIRFRFEVEFDPHRGNRAFLTPIPIEPLVDNNEITEACAIEPANADPAHATAHRRYRAQRMWWSTVDDVRALAFSGEIQLEAETLNGMTPLAPWIFSGAEDTADNWIKLFSEFELDRKRIFVKSKIEKDSDITSSLDKQTLKKGEEFVPLVKALAHLLSELWPQGLPQGVKSSDRNKRIQNAASARGFSTFSDSTIKRAIAEYKTLQKKHS